MSRIRQLRSKQITAAVATVIIAGLLAAFLVWWGGTGSAEPPAVLSLTR